MTEEKAETTDEITGSNRRRRRSHRRRRDKRRKTNKRINDKRRNDGKRGEIENKEKEAYLKYLRGGVGACIFYRVRVIGGNKIEDLQNRFPGYQKVLLPHVKKVAELAQFNPRRGVCLFHVRIHLKGVSRFPRERDSSSPSRRRTTNLPGK